MSLLRAGRNPDGTRQVIDLGPGRGRVAGHGVGLPLSEALTFVKVTPRPTSPVREPFERTRPLCGAWMPRNREECGRNPGHADDHRSVRKLDEDMAARREMALLQGETT